MQTCLERFASSGQFFNGLTGTSVNALTAIAVREPTAKNAVREVLKRSYPQPPVKPTRIQKRYCLSLAKRVHTALEKVTRKKVPFPREYNRATRAKLTKSW